MGKTAGNDFFQSAQAELDEDPELNQLFNHTFRIYMSNNGPSKRGVHNLMIKAGRNNVELAKIKKDIQKMRKKGSKCVNSKTYLDYCNRADVLRLLITADCHRIQTLLRGDDENG